MTRSVVTLVHGESGVGKTWFGDSTPAPRLVIDAEGGIDFTPSMGHQIAWDGRSEPPEADGSWETCVVRVTDFGAMNAVHQWLASGKHPFRSVTLDSVTEIQKRCMDAITGTETPEIQDWGTLLRKMEGLVRAFRDLKMHQTNPLEAVVFVCMTKFDDEKFRPFVQGALINTFPYFVDVIGYLYVDADPETNERVRRMLVQPHPKFLAKDRTNRLGTVIDEPTVEGMLDTIFGETGDSE